MVKRGEIYYADLSPAMGSEQEGIRPVVVIQNNVGNRYSPTVIVAAVTSRMNKNDLPTHVPIKIKGLKFQSIVLLEQIRTIDRMRLKEYVDRLRPQDMDAVDRALAVSVGLEAGKDGSSMTSGKGNGGCRI